MATATAMNCVCNEDATFKVQMKLDILHSCLSEHQKEMDVWPKGISISSQFGDSNCL